MSRRFRHTPAVAPLLAAVAMLGPVAAAQANDASLRAALKTDAPKINHSQAKILDGLATYQKTNSPSALIKAIHAQNIDLKSLQVKVSGDSPSSATGAKAKADIVKGLRLIIGSNNTLAKALQRSATGKPVSKSKLEAALSADRKGNADLNTGAKLLKV